MKKELIDHLDENGNVIGVIDKKVAHATGAWHKSIHLYLINNKNEILLQLRDPNKDIAPNVWDISVGGHVDAKEKTAKTACRELKEELGVQARQKDLQYLFTNKEILIYGKYNSAEFVDVFILEKDVTEKDIKLQKEEVADFKFVPVKDFINMIKKKQDGLFPHWEEYEKVLPYLKVYI